MEDKITESFLGIVAADVEKLLLENREQIAFAYQKIPDGLKLTLSINLDPSSNGIVVSYQFGFDLEPKPEPPEKHTVKYRHTIDELQASMELIGKEIREGRMSIECGDTKIGNVKQ